MTLAIFQAKESQYLQAITNLKGEFKALKKKGEKPLDEELNLLALNHFALAQLYEQHPDFYQRQHPESSPNETPWLATYLSHYCDSFFQFKQITKPQEFVAIKIYMFFALTKLYNQFEQWDYLNKKHDTVFEFALLPEQKNLFATILAKKFTPPSSHKKSSSNSTTNLYYYGSLAGMLASAWFTGGVSLTACGLGLFGGAATSYAGRKSYEVIAKSCCAPRAKK